MSGVNRNGWSLVLMLVTIAPWSLSQQFDIPRHYEIDPKRYISTKLPVLGSFPINGTKPIFGQHKGTDAIFALACKYPVSFYRRFVGSLRKFGFTEDIVLAVSPTDQMKPGVKEYVVKTGVVAYGFEVDCAGKDNCRLKDDFLGWVLRISTLAEV
jgi:hypothetical protein